MLPETRRPIGYWIKQADAALTQAIHVAQAGNGIARFEWQVLNLIYEGDHVPEPDIEITLASFANSDGIGAALARLAGRAWIATSAAGWGVTETGCHAHAQILAAQQQIRQQAMASITDDDYETTVRVLQQLAGNLGYPRG